VVMSSLLSSCAIEIGTGDTAATTAAPVTTPETATTTTTTGIDDEPNPPCAGETGFESDGVIAAFGRTEGDAVMLAGFAWTTHAECEQFVIDLTTVGGSPAASVGQTTVELRPETGILRIHLPPEIGSTAVADSVIDGELLTRAYVVRLVDRIAVDIHLTADRGVDARSYAVSSPTRIVVDVIAAESGNAVMPPRTADDIVLVEPRDEPAEYPLELSGYAGPSVTELSIGLAADETDGVQATVELPGGTGMWQPFTTIVPTGPLGAVPGYLGTGDPLDDDAPGLRLTLDLR
jgi:hypothetical protein